MTIQILSELSPAELKGEDDNDDKDDKKDDVDLSNLPGRMREIERKKFINLIIDWELFTLDK